MKFAARSSVDAEDLLNAGLLKLYELLPDYNPDKSSWATFAISRFSWFCNDFGRCADNRPTCQFHNRTQTRSVSAVSLEYLNTAERNGERAVMERIGRPDPVLEELEAADSFADLIKDLGKMARQVMLLRYVEALTMREIGEVLNVHQSRVSQIHKEAIAHLIETRKVRRPYVRVNSETN